MCTNLNTYLPLTYESIIHSTKDGLTPRCADTSPSSIPKKDWRNCRCEASISITGKKLCSYFSILVPIYKSRQVKWNINLNISVVNNDPALFLKQLKSEATRWTFRGLKDLFYIKRKYFCLKRRFIWVHCFTSFVKQKYDWIFLHNKPHLYSCNIK